ncbi:MAG: hypothetical protein WBF93_12535 [Pirellulales bacterium]
MKNRNSARRYPRTRGKDDLLGRALISLRPLIVTLHSVVLLTCGFCQPSHSAPPVYWNSLEGPLPSWKLFSSDAHPRLDRHRRVRDIVHSGGWAEAVTVSARTGSQVYLAHDLDRATIIDELSLAVWLRADRPGLQVAARVVFPRTEDSRTGQPLSVLIYGNLYRDAGTWQRLEIDGVPKRVSDQVRILRSGFVGQVDPKEAYVDRLLINAYGGSGTTNLWIDDVEVAGFIPKNRDTQPPVQAASFDQEVRLRSAQVVMRDSTAIADGKPFFPRIIDYHREPLSMLRDLGFNTVKINGAVTAEQNAQAGQSGLWIVSTDPSAEPSNRSIETASRILAWNMKSNRDVRSTIDQIRRLRAAEHLPRRLIVCDSRDDARDLRRHVDAIIARPPNNHSSFDLGHYGSWLNHVERISTPTTAVWAGIVTDLPDTDQGSATSNAAVFIARPAIPYSQIRQQVFLAIAAGARGLYFLSHHALHANDTSALHRQELLERINLELDLLEPWLTSRSIVETIQSNNPGMRAAVLQSERGRLLLPLPLGGVTEFSDAHPDRTIQFVVPGVPASNRAYMVRLDGLRPVPLRRVTGGGQLSLNLADRDHAILITEDPSVVNHISQNLRRMRDRMAQRTAERSPL